MYFFTVSTIIIMVFLREIYGSIVNKDENKLIPIFICLTFTFGAYYGYSANSVNFQQLYESLFLGLGCLFGVMSILNFKNGAIQQAVISFLGMGFIIGSSIGLNKLLDGYQKVKTELDAEGNKVSVGIGSNKGGLFEKSVTTYVNRYFISTIVMIGIFYLFGWYLSDEDSGFTNEEAGSYRVIGSLIYFIYMLINGVFLVAIPYLFVPLLIIGNVIRLYLSKEKSSFSNILPMWSLPGEFLFKLLLRGLTEGAMYFVKKPTNAAGAVSNPFGNLFDLRPQNIKGKGSIGVPATVLTVIILIIASGLILYGINVLGVNKLIAWILCGIIVLILGVIVLIGLGYIIKLIWDNLPKNKISGITIPDKLKDKDILKLLIGGSILIIFSSLLLAPTVLGNYCPKWCKHASWGGIGVGIILLILALVDF